MKCQPLVERKEHHNQDTNVSEHFPEHLLIRRWHKLQQLYVQWGSASKRTLGMTKWQGRSNCCRDSLSRRVAQILTSLGCLVGSAGSAQVLSQRTWAAGHPVENRPCILCHPERVILVLRADALRVGRYAVPTHGWRRGLHACAASRLESPRAVHFLFSPASSRKHIRPAAASWR